jgi:hypothetical protein
MYVQALFARAAVPIEMAGTEDGALCMYLTRVIYPFIYVQALFARAAEPLKMVGMMAFMMWMSGSQLHIFSIMTTLSGVYQPLMAILNSGQGAYRPPSAHFMRLRQAAPCVPRHSERCCPAAHSTGHLQRTTSTAATVAGWLRPRA